MIEANCHFTVVGRLEHLQDPRIFVVGALMPLVGSPKISRSWVTVQLKTGSEWKNGWTLFYSGVASGERQWPGVGFWSGGGLSLLFRLRGWTAVRTEEYRAFLEAGGGGTRKWGTGDSIVLLGHASPHLSSDSVAPKGSTVTWAVTVLPLGVWLGETASPVWTREVFCCWKSVPVTVWP